MENIQELINSLTIPEKAALLEGYESWMTNAVPRLNIPSIYLTDGPVGVRKKKDEKGEGVMGLGQSWPSTAFPTSVSIANSWNTENARRMGEAVGKECRAYDVNVLLGPALNLKRDPRCGRNFEYYSEDPVLAGKMAAAFTNGVQSTGTAACGKHFALNNSENFRYMGDSVIDERAARELYLKAFEICVRESAPKTMMCSYNKIRGVHASENKWLLTDVLREEWGFDGVVMSDWGAVRDRVEGVRAGLDLDMPGGVLENRRRIVEAAESGELPMDVLDQAAGNILRLVKECEDATEKPADMDALLSEHLELATEMACDCAVLLKNNGALPLTDQEPILVVGELFEKMRYQGAGSSGIHPAFLISPKDAFDRAEMTYEYTRGYREMSDEVDADLEIETLTAAKNVDTVLFFGGLTELFESEGFDRKDLAMPANQLSLIWKLCSAGKRVTVILFGGSPMELPFADDVTAILHMALPGEGGGEAVRRVLYGEAEPGGRLSETWMKTCEDIPFGDRFSRNKIECYRENIYVGYRFFDEAPEKIRYPFGYGLSYTSFAYRDLDIRQENGEIIAEVTIENVGERSGCEVVQLYAGRNAASAVFKARKELKAFAKVYLEAGESERVTLSLRESDLAYYNTRVKAWVLENGEYPIQIAASSRDIKLSRVVTISGQPEVERPYSDAAVRAYRDIARTDITDEVFAETVGYPVPEEPELLPYTLESPINDYQNSRSGRYVYSCITKGIAFTGKKVDKMPDGPEKDELIKNNRFILELIPRNCMRSLIQSSGGIAQMNVAHAVTAFANGKYLRGLVALLKRERAPILPCKKK